MGLLDVLRRLTGRTAAAAQPAAQPAQTASREPQRDAPAAEPELSGSELAYRFFEYTTGRACLEREGMSDVEQEVLQRLDRILEDPGDVIRWIPRPPAILPRLLACLRDDDASLRETCVLIRGDPYLATEVVRLANSALHQRGTPVTELERAAARLGFAGLQRAVTSSLLRPLFDTLRDPLLVAALPRLWVHGQAKGAWCQTLARQADVDAFDAYLSGLTHNVGWIGALKALGRDGPGPGPAAGYSRPFVLELARRSERMFALGAEQWAITAGLSRLGAVLRQSSLPEASDALAQVLFVADSRATREVAAG